MSFNEDSRVKIPAILHLVRLGYTYIPRNQQFREEASNIFSDIFLHSIQNINSSVTLLDAKKALDEVSLKLNFEDLGQDFYKSLTDQSGIKLIDFKNFANNSFHVTTELTCRNGDEEFRPDITILINGMPLAFIEVKKPNNKNGVIEERDRINRRFTNKKFLKFANVTQLMIFSNNMEYDPDEIEPIQGGFYATSAYADLRFNYFREEESLNFDVILKPSDEGMENHILKDNNLTSIKYSPEFETNKHIDTPTNRILTSTLQKDRLAFILKYAIAFVDEVDKSGNRKRQKHIMRYPQIFATKAIERKLDAGIRKGIIWHTQGSGKTALAYYNVKHLTDYYQKKSTIPKFYFIVDRLDLADQATKEFASRGLSVQRVNSREDFAKDIKRIGAIHNHAGKSEITVVNIQKFSEDATVVKTTDYDLNIQRIYFLDEVHRSYNPKGSFLANLINSDKNAVIIGLTGTPLITKDLYTKSIFGDYIHKYYYNMSIADGYTLKLIREEIDTSYKIQLQDILQKMEVLKGDLDRKQIFAHPTYVRPMLDYILNDFRKARKLQDPAINAMVVCDSSEQAKAMFAYFETLHHYEVPAGKFQMAAEPMVPYGSGKPLRGALILHDVNTKEHRKDQVEDFKDGKIDIFFVFNMLLTGFDAPRLKKMYLGRVIKDHNLLQALTRVNRPFKHFKYGYVVDFADIRAAFDKTNKAYFDELQAELGDEMENYSNIFKSQAEIEHDIKNIREALFQFDTRNAENFRHQISAVPNKTQVLEIVKALRSAKELHNLIKLFGYDDLMQKIDFFKLGQLLGEAERHLAKINEKEALASATETTNLLNIALEDVIFMFRKVSESELVLADKLKETLRRTRETFLRNFDPNDPEFINLKEELERMFRKKNLDEISQTQMNENIVMLNQIYDRIKELNRKDALLAAKYDQDEKYTRVHKRIKAGSGLSVQDSEIHEALTDVKKEVDEHVLNNQNLLNNESYFQQYLLKLVYQQFKQKHKIGVNADTTKYINSLIVNEYIKEYHGFRS